MPLLTKKPDFALFKGDYCRLIKRQLSVQLWRALSNFFLGRAKRIPQYLSGVYWYIPIFTKKFLKFAVMVIDTICCE
jgi:hypothetical protein